MKAQCGTLLFMAPEILFQPSYTKAVDLWSCSIIMYMLLNRGNHPLHEDQMDIDQYKQRLAHSSFPPLKDKISQNFIEKISNRDYTQRYSVNQALKHPWITRNFDEQIPLSVYQSYHSFSTTHQINHSLKLALCLQNIGLAQAQKHKVCYEYRFKVSQFSENNEKRRVSSPSRRKMGEKNQQLFKRVKNILNETGLIPKSSDQQKNSNSFNDQPVSPILKQHDRFFMNLFERQKIKKKDTDTIALISIDAQCIELQLKKAVSCKQSEKQVKQETQISRKIQSNVYVSNSKPEQLLTGKDKKKFIKSRNSTINVSNTDIISPSRQKRKLEYQTEEYVRPATGGTLRNSSFYSRGDRDLRFLGFRENSTNMNYRKQLTTRINESFLLNEKRPNSQRNPVNVSHDKANMKMLRINSIAKNSPVRPMIFGKNSKATFK